ncbi:MAG: hypothetical protein PUF83_05060 [Intestinibaculum porci]|uniref:DUF7601 domain-containing protein n=1 Tax=Intestinibaculum porci TaxID=2487118 RepID=UPI002409EC5A|nr:hypothetical protein [Intestinibaculum porci]MDD6422420.1 hypothetical protein [Intestinibaculum porci]
MNKKYLKGLLSLSLSGMMAASLAAPVFADTNTNPTDAKAYITKQFDMPVGTTLPSNAAFTFNEGNLSKDGQPYSLSSSDGSNVGYRISGGNRDETGVITHSGEVHDGLSFAVIRNADHINATTTSTRGSTNQVNAITTSTSTDQSTGLSDKPIEFNSNTTKKTIEVNGAGNEHKIYRYLASTPLLTPGEEAELKKAPGVYTFTIKEQAPDGYAKTNKENDDTKKIQKDTKLTYSQAEYKATVYVKTGANGAYIGTIKVTKEKDDQGKSITAENEKKVDPSQPDDNIPGSGGLRFVNTYTEKITDTNPNNPGKLPDPDPDPNNPTNPNNDRDKILSVGKIVSGDLGDKNKKFTFTVKVTHPSLVTSDETYTAKVFTADGNPDGEYTFTNGVANKDVKLSHGEKLVFKDLYVGTAFEAQETDGDTSYTSSTYARLNGGDPTEKAKERALIKGNVSEKTDTVVVVNTRNSTSPTGIVVNNLPYILLVLGVVAGFAGYIASKRRREVR